MWKPATTAPMNSKRPLIIAAFDEAGELIDIDYNTWWVGESESRGHGYWGSEHGRLEEPTHWMCQPDWFMNVPTEEGDES